MASDNPGPGNYNSHNLNSMSKNDSAKASIRGKPTRNDNTLGPGPGGYN